MYAFILIIGSVVCTHATFYPDFKGDHFMSNMLLQNLIERMSNELADEDSYIDNRDVGRGLPDKEIPIELPIDYDGIDALNPKTSIRDQEYLQHSTLWSHQQLNNYKSNDRHKIKPGNAAAVSAVATATGKTKDGKSETQLPAYCTPPNPCPVGYTSENQCIENFENTAAFSRDYQSAQECMCDSEHMIECPNSVDEDSNVVPGMPITNADFDQIVERFEEDNPYFRGEKLPIAAKKGFNIAI
ncbi:neuroendocrine protein 7B2 [Phymastichus coffea]|uniref:neuroendocrine protein 7B2 n=1 Tax=Phymastichus coffea TaxID=108790 RepID=UPI00273CBA31|nr:neuroendocrine protein 7B2 [Phymastichus coffea]XP_058801592.1 neuroendocrine protein 7B2 [Phymastichus coffea]XP_058801593.1 neuroendocrine protein 7B2 [Phymastichus coffea]XP_058801594.1 neuroendocrine protein 7B2 [Phymastichus coffea]